ncbi:LANO_0D10550g1_1 [Lachancea nothofagi CBS 11611]|uniref:rRNA-processing protein FYV7 n=1 Tax=Lachancea nothofagi CBS 11611 TaxID=1266666 RepID=A0A1G4JKW9_9SACH|nr:LANO_0D10550g1_1 [Lachancea nothofagi CBS 11611]
MPPRIEKHSKEYKVREIQKNLVKKARLKKDYFKALKEEGYAVPDKKSSEAKLSYKELKAQNAVGNRQKLDEKKELKKMRGRQQHDKALQRQKYEQDKVKEVRDKEKQRNVRSSKVTQRTRSGQPLMGPKIEDLLGKIKADDTYTK